MHSVVRYGRCGSFRSVWMERFPVVQILISGVMLSPSWMKGGGVNDVFPGFAYMCGRCGVGDTFRRCSSVCRS